MNASTPEIVRCLKHDLDGDLLAAARYAQRIAAAAALNPWAEPAMAGNYAAAAKLLLEQHDQREHTLAVAEAITAGQQPHLLQLTD